MKKAVRSLKFYVMFEEYVVEKKEKEIHSATTNSFSSQSQIEIVIGPLEEEGGNDYSININSFQFYLHLYDTIPSPISRSLFTRCIYKS